MTAINIESGQSFCYLIVDPELSAMVVFYRQKTNKAQPFARI